MNRKRLPIGIAVFIILVILVGFGTQWWRKNHRLQVDQRSLAPNLTYCNEGTTKPCIVSFDMDAEGNMLVNLLTFESSYPDFYLTISDDNVTNKYSCEKVEDFPTNVYCTGKQMRAGKTLQFKLFSSKDDTVLAEGKFAIIGLLLSNPSMAATETSPATATVELSKSPTPFPLVSLTPISTSLVPSAIVPNTTARPTRSYP